MTIWTLLWLRRPDVRNRFPAPVHASQSDRTKAYPTSYGTTAAMILIGIVLLGGMTYWLLDRGTLVVDSADDSVQLSIHSLVHDTFDGKTGRSQWSYPGKTITGSGSLRLRSGAYMVFLDDQQESYELSQRRFVLGRGEEVLIKVRRKASSLPK